MYNEETNPIIGFILLVEYPGCSKAKGYFERYTTGEFIKYPEIWKPVHKYRKLPVENY